MLINIDGGLVKAIEIRVARGVSCDLPLGQCQHQFLTVSQWVTAYAQPMTCSKP